MLKIMWRHFFPSLFLCLAGMGAGCDFASRHPKPVQSPEAATEALTALSHQPGNPMAVQPIQEALRSELAIHRRLVVLFADEGRLQGAFREAALHRGHQLHHEDRALVFQLDQVLASLAAQAPIQRDPIVASLLDWMERAPELLELDKLAFRDPLRILKRSLGSDRSPQGQALLARITGDLAAIDRIEARVEDEYRQSTGHRGQAGHGGERPLWGSYVDRIKRLVAEPTPQPAPTPSAQGTGSSRAGNCQTRC